MLAALAALALIPIADLPETLVRTGMAISVRDFAAQGNGEGDDTKAFQSALDAAGKTGARVLVPPGRYAIRGTLTIPESVTLEGTFQAPPRTIHNRGKLEQEKGSILLAYSGRGDEHGEPFISLNRNSHLRGVIVFYPEQDFPVVPYPWTVRGHGDNVSITNSLLINPYQAVDFGTFPCGRHYINGLYAHALKTGLFIDKCFDVGRVENAHFWPFWRDEKQLLEWTAANATAFIIARTDWQYMTNCFAIAYQIGFHFISKEDGPGNAVLSQCGSDIGPVAVRVDAVQHHSGVSFVNGQIMAGVEVSETNTGPVKFTSCGFWGVEKTTDYHARIRGTGHVTFTGCHFVSWALANAESAAIVVEAGGLTVSGCEFVDGGDKNHIELHEAVEAAVISGNRFRSPPKITNRSKGVVEIFGNVAPKRS